jgi:hypothetical protein
MAIEKESYKTTLTTKLAEELNQQIFGSKAEWVNSPYGGATMSPRPIPNIPSANGKPMHLVARIIVKLFEAHGMMGVTARPRDCIAGDGEPVVDIMVPNGVYEEKIKDGKFAGFSIEHINEIKI